MPGASLGPPLLSDSKQLCETAQQAKANGSGPSDTAHRAAAALHLRVCWSTGAYRHYQGGASAGAAGHPQLQVHVQMHELSFFFCQVIFCAHWSHEALNSIHSS